MTPSILGTGFQYHTEIHRLDGSVESAVDHNLLPQEAVTFIAGLLRNTEAPIGTWYIGLFEGNYVPDKNATAAILQSTIVECTAYTEGTRPEWTHAFDGNSLIDNLNARATFTFNADKRVYGAFLISASGKGGTTGRLLSIARFSQPKDISAGEPFTVAAGITLIPTDL